MFAIVCSTNVDKRHSFTDLFSTAVCRHKKAVISAHKDTCQRHSALCLLWGLVALTPCFGLESSVGVDRWIEQSDPYRMIVRIEPVSRRLFTIVYSCNLEGRSNSVNLRMVEM